MSASPPKETEVEQGAQSGDDPEHMEREQEGNQGQGLGDFEVKEQDRWLPIANVARIMKTALPENAKIAKEAKECMQECVSEFISFITSEASEKCQQEKRKTVNGEDILFAMTSLGFENYSEALKIYLSKFRENRPTSAGGYNSGGPVGGGAPGTGPNAVTAPGPSFPTESQNANNILSPHLDPAEHDAASYAYPGMVAASHNGTGAEY
ncbi:MAG: hypothetical protein Q9160_004938 [Pyrenula sp. 1 TL-2023]